MAKYSDLRRKGACNQGKEAFRAKSMQSGQLRSASVTTGEARQTESLHNQENVSVYKSYQIETKVGYY